jgi:hypothetical protein
VCAGPVPLVESNLTKAGDTATTIFNLSFFFLTVWAPFKRIPSIYVGKLVIFFVETFTVK